MLTESSLGDIFFLQKWNKRDKKDGIAEEEAAVEYLKLHKPQVEWGKLMWSEGKITVRIEERRDVKSRRQFSAAAVAATAAELHVGATWTWLEGISTDRPIS